VQLEQAESLFNSLKPGRGLDEWLSPEKSEDRIQSTVPPKEIFMHEEPKKDELTDDEIQDMVPGMGPF